MRPLAVLIGIVMGSTVSISVGLILTGIVLLFLPDEAGRVSAERASFLQSLGLMLALAAVSAFSFYGELRSRAWRIRSHAGLVLMLALCAWLYWPQAA